MYLSDTTHTGMERVIRRSLREFIHMFGWSRRAHYLMSHYTCSGPTCEVLSGLPSFTMTTSYVKVGFDLCLSSRYPIVSDNILGTGERVFTNVIWDHSSGGNE